MSRRILSIGMVCVVVASLTAVVGATPAQAATSDRARPTRSVAPPAPPASPAARAAAAAVSASPQVSPAAWAQWLKPGDTYVCESGNFCVFAWDATYLVVDGSGGAKFGAWRLFKLWACHEYALSNFYGNGYWKDNQTPQGPFGVTSYFKNQYHNTRVTITPDNVLYAVNWDPIWYIQNC